MFPLERGGGDAALVDAGRGRPQTVAVPIHSSLLKQGENKIVLTAFGGSWLLYDAVALRRVAEKGASIQAEAKPTIFFVKREGQLKQVVRLRVLGLPPKQPVKLTIRAGSHLPR